MLHQIAEQLWVASAAQTFIGLHVGTRMAVVRLEDGGLWVHSPVPLRAELKAQLDDLGDVTDIVAPNLGHHLYASQYKEAYPRAQLHTAKGVDKRNKTLVSDYMLGSMLPQRWGGELETVSIEGTLLNESVFLHNRTGTLICADLLENFDSSPHLPTRMYLRMSGIHGKPGLSRMLRPTFYNRDKSRASIDKIIQWDFDRIVLAHGDVIEQDGKVVLVHAYEWLKA